MGIKLSTAIVKDLISNYHENNVKIVTLEKIRSELQIEKGTAAFDDIRNIMFQLVKQKIVKMLDRGEYKIIQQVTPIAVFGIERERRPPFELTFPRNFDTMMEMDFVEDVVIREGDLILISGMSNYGKTTLCLNFCGENIDSHPVLMGNEYTTTELEPTPRFLNRLDAMDWVNWADVDGNDKFTLLPVRDDYAEHIIKNRINIIDWLNIETGEHYMIGSILGNIKKNLGRGIAIIAIQKAEGTTAGRGGQFTKDFADLELLIDRFGRDDVLLTIGKVKEHKHNPIGKTYAYSISKGVKIMNFREVKRCPPCHGAGYIKGQECANCIGKKFVDK